MRCAGVVAGVGGLMLLLMAGCAERDVPPEVTSATDGPTQESWDVNFAIEVDGVRRARLAAGYAARFEREDSTFARFSPAESGRRVRVHVYDADGQLSATVEADEIEHLEERRIFIATGNVVVQSETDRQLEGERLTWDEAGREIRSDGFVRITTPSERLQGYRLVADESLETYRLARITGQVEVEDA